MKYKRRLVDKQIPYKKYKRIIREDFVYRCGYCGTHENAFGGYKQYQIDHLRPKSIPRFEHLTNDYSNLVYCCPECNRVKLDYWPSDNPIRDGYGWIDPCVHDYDEHFIINLNEDSLSIQNKTALGKWLVIHLGLDQIVRQEFIRSQMVTIKRLNDLKIALDNLKEKLDPASTVFRGITQSQKDLMMEIQKMNSPMHFRSVKIPIRLIRIRKHKK